MNTADSGVAQTWASPVMILHAMKAARRWLIWLAADGRKIPYYVNGAPRAAGTDLDAPQDAAQFASFDEAVAEARRRGEAWGVGFALGPDGTGNYWQGIDLDKVEENGLADLANTLPGYVEYSPSGKGCHAIGYGRRFDNLNNNKSGVEAYCEKRYFTFTGNQIVRAS